MSAQKTITVQRPFKRTVTLSPVNWACAWCGAPRSEEGYPGSYASLLCPACRCCWAQPITFWTALF